MKTMTVIELNNIGDYPPVQNLIRVLLNIGYKVNLIGRNISEISVDILANKNYTGYETVKHVQIGNIIQKFINRAYTTKCARSLLYLRM